MRDTRVRQTDQIKQFWEENPVGSNFVQGEPTREFFQQYDDFRYRTEGHILDELDRFDFNGKKVLEIGIGQAADSMQLIDRGAIYSGLDLTANSVNRAKERFRIFSKKYQNLDIGNAEHMGYPDASFDLVYSHGVIHHSAKIARIVGEIHRVLAPGGKALVMLYHQNSLNYYLSIGLIRRFGLLILWIFPFLLIPVSKVSGEPAERIRKHLMNLSKYGLSYLSMNTFIHKSTDGPDNVFSSVWSRKSACKLFGSFRGVEFRVHFLNERHLLGLQLIFPSIFRTWLSQRWGWHLWVEATK